MTEAKRDRYGRYLLPAPEDPSGSEQSWTRATTLAGALEDQYNLTRWRSRMVALGLARRADLLALAAGSDPEDKKQLDDLCERALQAAGSDKNANRGVALHKFAERLDAGEDSGAPDEFAGHLALYRRQIDAYGLRPHPSYIERITVVPSLGVAGTIDRIVKHEGKPRIADLKTGSTVDFGQMKMAVQLAIYANGDGLWDERNGEFEPMPAGLDKTTGLIIHLPSDRLEFTLYKVDLETGWELAQRAFDVRAARKSKYLRKVKA